MTKGSLRGFTLIELAIVLVVIGLIVGGVLVGRDLVTAAAVRAQISQIERYNTAVNTFRGKYGYLPGDIKDPVLYDPERRRRRQLRLVVPVSVALQFGCAEL